MSLAKYRKTPGYFPSGIYINSYVAVAPSLLRKDYIE